MFSSKRIKYVAVGIAAIALGFGGYAIDNAVSGNGNSAVANSTRPPVAGQLPGNGGPRAGGPRLGGNGSPRFGTPVTATTASKVSSAATAKYPGTVQGVFQLSDGSYVARVITSSGPYRVSVSKDFQVTGANAFPAGAPGAPGAPPSGATPPSA